MLVLTVGVKMFAGNSMSWERSHEWDENTESYRPTVRAKF
jgi:hypothetical protein